MIGQNRENTGRRQTSLTASFAKDDFLIWLQNVVIGQNSKKWENTGRGQTSLTASFAKVDFLIWLQNVVIG